MIDFSRKKPGVSPEILMRTIWVSQLLAVIFTVPPLGLFLGIYFTTGNLIVGLVIGFGVHFVILAFSGRISKTITQIVS